LSSPLRSKRAAAESDYPRFADGQRLERGLLLDLAERGLAPRAEDHGDRVAGAGLDLAVEVHEITADPSGRLFAERRLAGPHEADESNVPVYRGDQSMRSR
jgi:hypothetical protein